VHTSSPERPAVPAHLADVLGIDRRQIAPDVMTVPELAEFLRLTEGTTYQYLREGVIPATRAGRRGIISRRRIEHWINGITGTEEA
jgi:excisionase family DNA binding protein